MTKLDQSIDTVVKRANCALSWQKRYNLTQKHLDRVLKDLTSEDVPGTFKYIHILELYKNALKGKRRSYKTVKRFEENNFWTSPISTALAYFLFQVDWLNDDKDRYDFIQNGKHYFTGIDEMVFRDLACDNLERSE